jgi:excinuclease ABC subunit C
MMREELKARVESLPASPGVYLFKDRKGKVIYVGKAKSLRSRVRSYFREGEPLPPRTAVLVSRTHGLDFMITRSEVEALILECNLIKHFKPRYNVNLKDDKKYPYIKVTTREPFPSVRATRNLKQDGSRYFGPYTDAKAMRKTLRLLNEIFPLRTCKRNLPLRVPDRGCLNYQIGRCLGPCRGDVSSESYKRLVHQVCQYLSGRMTDLIKDVHDRMEDAAAKLRFEEAARLRDTAEALEKVSQKQIVVSSRAVNRDVAAVRFGEGRAIGFVLKVREGKLVGKGVYRMTYEGQPEPGEINEAFLEQYLAATTSLPDEILIQRMPQGVALIEKWLKRRAGKNIKVLSPRTGKGADLLRMAGDNASLVLSQMGEAGKARPEIPAAVTELARWLHLSGPPVATAAFDISTIQGAEPTGSRVYFRNGRPVKGLYRLYTIRDVQGQDDFAMMREVLRRAWGHVEAAEEERPDLILVDGGKGQVSSAIKGILEAGCPVEALPEVAGIAKRLDEIFRPGRSAPVQIPHGSPALRLLQRIRDEAHRFAITHHRRLRRRRSLKSRLEEARGIGPVLSKRLLGEFGSLGGIEKAGVEGLVSVRGMNRRKAEILLEFLKGEGSAGKQ